MDNIDEVVQTAEQLVFAQTGKCFSDVQRVILREACQESKRTYDQIAAEHSYSSNYVQQVAGPRLWRLLTKVLGQKVSKANAYFVLRQEIVPQLKAEGRRQPALSEAVGVAAPEGLGKVEGDVKTEGRRQLALGEAVGVAAPKGLGKAEEPTPSPSQEGSRTAPPPKFSNSPTPQLLQNPKSKIQNSKPPPFPT
ncbi:MAG: hypothetical protein AAGD25_23780 [Cyanobacteria bacterium P01_F01_bin.150]